MHKKATCKREDCHLGTGAQEIPDLLDIVPAAGDDVDHAGGNSGLMNNGSQGKGGKRSVFAGLHDTRATSNDKQYKNSEDGR